MDKRVLGPSRDLEEYLPDERAAGESPRDRTLQQLQKAEELKGHLVDWLSRSHFASGIDVDDQKLTIFCPKDEEEAVLSSLKTEVRTVLGRRSQNFLNSFKVKPYRMFSIRRQQCKIGSGSHIYHLDQRGQPLYVTLGAMFIDLIGNDLYCLTTSHLEDAKGKNFYFSSNNLHTTLGRCVGYIQQTNPLLEACLIRIDKAAYSQCSPVLLPELLQSPVAFRGPYTGAISELLAAPQEVMLCGGETDLTRGRMKYYAFDFSDPDTDYKVYGGIVTLPIHPGDFVTEGDSGATISIASSQSFLVKDWCLGSHTTGMSMDMGSSIRRDALPSTSHDETEGPSTGDNAGTAHSSEEQQVDTESIQNMASAPREVSLCQDQQELSPDLYLHVQENTTGTDKEQTALKTFNGRANTSDDQDDLITIKIIPEDESCHIPEQDQISLENDHQSEHGAVSQDCEEEKTTVKTVCSRQSSVNSAEDQNAEHGQTDMKQFFQPSLAPDINVSQDQTLLTTASPPTRPYANLLEEVMAHEAISTHCFSGRIVYEEEPPEHGSISFRMDLAVEKLQEQIGAELRLVPILMKSTKL